MPVFTLAVVYPARNAMAAASIQGALATKKCSSQRNAKGVTEAASAKRVTRVNRKQEITRTVSDLTITVIDQWPNPADARETVFMTVVSDYPDPLYAAIQTRDRTPEDVRVELERIMREGVERWRLWRRDNPCLT